MALLTKLDVARHQLGTALDLFIRDRDPITVQCLACGGGELIEAIATVNNLRLFSTHMLESMPDLDIKRIRTLRQYWNAFSDGANDAALFIGWHDYYAVTGRLPLPVQVFQPWWFSLNEEKLAEGADLATIRELFPDIVNDSRRERKTTAPSNS